MLNIQVQSLKDMAFQALFLEIVHYLSIVKGYFWTLSNSQVVKVLENEKTETVMHCSYTDRVTAHGILLKKAATALQEKLLNKASPGIRRRLIDEFLTKYQDGRFTTIILLFLDCLMDGSVTEFTLDEKMFHLLHPYFNSTILLATISKRCTNLASLKVSYTLKELPTLNLAYSLPLANLKVVNFCNYLYFYL